MFALRSARFRIPTLAVRYLSVETAEAAPAAATKVVVPEAAVISTGKKNIDQSPWKVNFLVKLVCNLH
jgi:hypothetical protein